MINNNLNLFVGYGLAGFLYIGYTVSLHVRRRNLLVAIAAMDNENQNR